MSTRVKTGKSAKGPGITPSNRTTRGAVSSLPPVTNSISMDSADLNEVNLELDLPPTATLMPTVKPDDVDGGMWLILSSISHDVKGNTANLIDIVRDNINLKNQMTTLERRMELLEVKQIRQDQVILRQQNQITDLTTRSMKKNIVFTFDPRSDYGKLAISWR